MFEETVAQGQEAQEEGKEGAKEEEKEAEAKEEGIRGWKEKAATRLLNA